MTSLALATLFFLGIHVFVSGTALRGALVARIGDKAFRGSFALASLGAIVWMSRAYAAAPAVSLWPSGSGTRTVVLILMAFAFLLVAIGMATPSPTALGAEKLLAEPEPARGILRVTRHPFLSGVAVWAACHVVANGDAASLVFFGGFLCLALVGPLLIDRKRRAAAPAGWERFAAVTSIVPFAAILGGRNSFVAGELGRGGVAIGLALYALFLVLHPWLFGVSPFPH